MIVLLTGTSFGMDSSELFLMPELRASPGYGPINLRASLDDSRLSTDKLSVRPRR